MKKFILFLIGSFIFLYGCSGYMLQGKEDSVITDAVSESMFSVTFCGNAYMDKKEAKKYALQRASELCLKKGFTHFLILEENDQSEICMLQDTPRSAYPPGIKEGSSTGYFGPESLVRPNISLKIQCYRKDAPAESIDAQKYLSDNFPGLKFKKQ